MLRASTLAALALACMTGAAEAQRADRPDVSVGDRWDFVVYHAIPSSTPNRTWVITSTSPERIDGTENGDPLVLTRELNVVDSPRYSDSTPQALTFPLEVGKRWRYASDWVFKPKNSKGSSVVDVTVVSHEAVRVPAGEFAAFRLVATSRIRGISGINSVIDAEVTTTYWYAPAAHAIVKSVSQHPYLGPSTVELVHFQLRR